MPISLRSFGLKLNRIHRKRERKLIGSFHRVGGLLRDATDKLDADLIVFLNRLANRIYVGGKISKEKWRKVRRRAINVDLVIPYRKFDARVEKDSNDVQELAFMDTIDRMHNKFEEIYPIRKRHKVSKTVYRKNVKKLDFIDSELELKFLTGREVTEAELMNQIRKTEKLIESFLTSHPSDDRDDGFILVIGTGKIDDDFLLFAEGQEAAGLSPADLLGGISTLHVGKIQKGLIRTTRQSIERGVSKKTYISRAFNMMAKKIERTELVKGAMGVMRGAHQRAAAGATSMLSLFNKKKVTMLMRVTSGGRSCIACFPAGHTISTANDSDDRWYFKSPYSNEQSERTINGEMLIENIKIGDVIYNGSGILDYVEQVHCNEYEGDLIEIELENGQKITPTPNHKIFVRRNDRKLKVRADNVRTTDELIELFV